MTVNVSTKWMTGIDISFHVRQKCFFIASKNSLKLKLQEKQMHSNQKNRLIAPKVLHVSFCSRYNVQAVCVNQSHGGILSTDH